MTVNHLFYVGVDDALNNAEYGVNALWRAIIISTNLDQTNAKKIAVGVNALWRAIIISTQIEAAPGEDLAGGVNALWRAIIISTVSPKW